MKESLKKLINVAAGRVPADVVIKNCKVVNVFSGEIEEGNIAICDGQIAGIGEYEGLEVIDAEGRYAAPGFIDSHIHIESSYVSPEELGRLLVPHGGTTIMADPHEIANVCGEAGLAYMIEAGKRTALDIKYELPSCVPATPFENAGAVLSAREIEKLIPNSDFIGLGEFMNFPGVIYTDEDVMDKIVATKQQGKWIDGHGSGLEGNALNAYVSAGILADHECSTVEEMKDRLARGQYILLRQGSACHNLRTLLKGMTEANSRRCLLCSDDRQPKTILHEGHLDNHLQICVEEGVNLTFAGEFRYLDTKSSDLSQVEEVISLPETVEAPVKEGQPIGEAVYRLQGERIGSVSILAAKSIEKAGYGDYLKKAFARFLL